MNGFWTALVALVSIGSSAPTPNPVMVEGWAQSPPYSVDGRFSVDASPEKVWEVLTDYEHLSGFISSIRRSSVLQQSQDGIEVNQVMRAKVLFVSKSVHLRLHIGESPFSRIEFRDVLGKDFKTYEGSWDLVKAGSGTVVTYHLRFAPSESLPSFVSNRILRQTVQALLTELRVEIVRRNPSPN